MVAPVQRRQASDGQVSPGDYPATFDLVVDAWAKRRPDRPACVFLTDDDQQQTLTYAQLDQRARAVAASLAERLTPGSRALLVYPAGLEFVVAFLGCQYAGVVAVPATHPKPRRPLPRMRRIAEDSGARVALTSRATLESIDFSQQDDTVQQLDWIATDELHQADESTAGEHLTNETRGHAALSFLQYTSGSTSNPKGVMVSHANLMANLEAIRVSFGIEFGADDATDLASQTGVFWLPAYHDMGLIGGVLTPLYVGGTTVLMSPGSFLQRPAKWLRAISEFGASISGAPNFAYDYCVRRIAPDDREGLDLSRWRLAFCGAEPVRADTLRRFAESFEPAGFSARAFYPCYGLAEATLLAAGPDHDDNPTLLAVDRASVGAGSVTLARQTLQSSLKDQLVSSNGDGGPVVQELVGCGRAPEGHKLLVINPETREPLEERQVGEILIAGPSVTRGYWDRTDLNDALWTTITGHGDDRFLRTGDLGFVHQNELFVTGRLKDVIVLRGQNHYPQDIEETAEGAHKALLPSAAFTVGGGPGLEGPERLVVVAQVERSCSRDDYPEIARAIRTAVSQTHGLDTSNVVLIRQATLPVTSSGKVQRSLCRERYEADELRVLHELSRAHANPDAASAKKKPAAKQTTATTTQAANKPARTAAEIETWLGAWLVERLGLDPTEMSRDRPFAELGVDSLTAVELSGELEQEFGVPLPAIVAWNHPTPASLAGYLAEQSAKPTKATEPAATTEEESAPAAPFPAAPAAPEESDAEVESLLAQIEQMSEEEARRLLGG